MMYTTFPGDQLRAKKSADLLERRACGNFFQSPPPIWQPRTSNSSNPESIQASRPPDPGLERSSLIYRGTNPLPQGGKGSLTLCPEIHEICENRLKSIQKPMEIYENLKGFMNPMKIVKNPSKILQSVEIHYN